MLFNEIQPETAGHSLSYLFGIPPYGCQYLQLTVIMSLTHPPPHKRFWTCRIGRPAAMGGLSTGTWPSSCTHTVAIGRKPSLCHWRRKCGSIKQAIGDQNLSSRKTGGTEEAQRKKQQAQRRQASRATMQTTSVPPSGWELAGFHGVAVLRRPSGGAIMLCLQDTISINVGHNTSLIGPCSSQRHCLVCRQSDLRTKTSECNRVSSFSVIDHLFPIRDSLLSQSYYKQ